MRSRCFARTLTLLLLVLPLSSCCREAEAETEAWARPLTSGAQAPATVGAPRPARRFRPLLLQGLLLILLLLLLVGPPLPPLLLCITKQPQEPLPLPPERLPEPLGRPGCPPQVPQMVLEGRAQLPPEPGP